MFAVGDKVVYPMQGAGVVKTIEKRERDGQSVDSVSYTHLVLLNVPKVFWKTRCVLHWIRVMIMLEQNISCWRC